MLRNYFKTAWRNLMRQKVFSFINITGLALSLTTVWLISLYVADELSYDRYHEKADRIYRLASHGHWGDEKFDITGTSGLAADAFKKDFPEVEDAVRINPEGGGIVEYEDKKFREDAIFFADPSFFSIFTYHFLSGNEEALKQPNTIVINESLATKLFQDPESALGKSISIDKYPCTVSGVIEDVPANSHVGFSAIRTMPSNYQGDWQNLSIYTYILLKKNADISRLRSKMPDFVTKYLTSNAQNVRFNLELQPLTSIHLHSHLSYELSENRDVKYVYVLSIVGLLILIIAFINYTNITTARASVRLREVAVRKIIGSSRTNLTGLFLVESVLTILLAAVISTILVNLIMQLFNNITGKQLSIWRFGLTQTILYILGFTLFTGIVGGWYPSFFLSRFKTIPALKNQLGDVKGQSFFRKSLVMFQFIVTVVMITSSLVIYLQLNFVLNKDLGFNKKQLLTFHLDSKDLRRKVPAFRMALLQNPLIKAAASAGNPIGNNNIGMMDYSVEKNGVLDERSNLAYGLTIDPDFIPAMQIKLLEGRNFSVDIPSDTFNVVVNEAFVKKQGWPSAMGRRISRGRDSTGKINFSNIIGVVNDFHIYSLQHKIEPIIMEMPRRAEDRDNIYVRLDQNHESEALSFLTATFRKFDNSSPFDYHFLDQNFAAQYAAEGKQGQLLLSFTILSICIACMGLFGLIMFTVGQRVKEIGIRKVLGASVSSMVFLLTESLLKVVLIAMLVAIPISYLVMHKWLQDFAYRIDLHWWIFLAAGIISIAIATITMGVQAIRAALANPVVSLKTE
ncbi:MAG: hypothetical protein C5B52_16220 [Bacteroidetes bacterium]|nr:MAG: hypothetical protein C5B52_16220 [Bacteroidota bacterium]